MTHRHKELFYSHPYNQAVRYSWSDLSCEYLTLADFFHRAVEIPSGDYTLMRLNALTHLQALTGGITLPRRRYGRYIRCIALRCECEFSACNPSAAEKTGSDKLRIVSLSPHRIN